MNIEKAESAYREVQKQITKGDLYELYGDVERLIPDHIKPGCIEKVVEIQQYVRETKSPRKKAAETPRTKRKRNDDIMRNIPDGASTGFVSVRDLVAKQGPKPKKIKISKNFDALGEDDETDEDIEMGRVLAPPRRTQSAVGSSSRIPGGKTIEREKGKLRKSSTIGSKPRKKKTDVLTLNRFTTQGSDDSDDIDIEQGAISAHRQKSNGAPLHSDKQRVSSRRPPFRTLSQIPDPISPPSAVIVELTDSEHETLSRRQKIRSLSSLAQITPNTDTLPDEDMGWVVNDDEDDLLIEIVDSSPRPPQSDQAHFDRVCVDDESFMISRPRLHSKSRDSFQEPKAPVGVDESVVEIVESELVHSGFPSSPVSTQRTPESTFPISRIKRKRVVIEDEETESPRMGDMPPRLQRSLRIMESTPPKDVKKAKVNRAKPTILGRGANPLFDGEAIHSGDEISEGQSNSEDDVESESDRQFIKNSPLTQATPSYDQSQIYRRSLMSQLTGENLGAGPAFARTPVRSKPFWRFDYRRGIIGGLPSSSPPPPNEELDTYEYGSFVVADDDFRG